MFPFEAFEILLSNVLFVEWVQHGFEHFINTAYNRLVVAVTE